MNRQLLEKQVRAAKDSATAGRVNSVNPGFTLTEGTNSYLGSDFVDGLVARYLSVALVNPKKWPLLLPFWPQAILAGSPVS